MFIADLAILTKAVELFDRDCDLGVAGHTSPVINYLSDGCGLRTNEFGVIHFPHVSLICGKFYAGEIVISYKSRENGKRYYAVYGFEIDGTLHFWSC